MFECYLLLSADKYILLNFLLIHQNFVPPIVPTLWYGK